MAKRSQPETRTGPALLAHEGGGGVVLFMFFLSGVAALVYQIVWAKALALVFGVTIYATSAVITTFMAGLALGSLYFGRVVDRWKKPLVLFALLEAGIGVFAVIFPLLLILIEKIYVALYGPFGNSHYVMSLIRFVLSFLVLIVPTMLMGGTLPVIARAHVSSQEHVGGKVAGLYAANNLGAFLGCVGAGYVLLELLGKRGSLLVAGALNLIVLALALSLHAQMSTRSMAEADKRKQKTSRRRTGKAAAEERAGPDQVRLPIPVKVALWVFCIEGFTSLAFQIAWLRTLIFFVSSNIYGVTAIVATFLAGLSLGSYLVKRLVDRTGNPYRLVGVIELGIAVTALATVPVLPWLLGLHEGLGGVLQRSEIFTAGLATTFANFAVTFVVILVPTALMGATLPVVSRIYVSGMRGLGRKIGFLGCLDTVGSIFGAFVAGFVLIPLLGAQRTLIAAALVNLALAVCMFAVDPVSQRRVAVRAGFIASVAALVLTPLLFLMDPVPLIIHSPQLASVPNAQVREYRENAEGAVSVIDEPGVVQSLYVDQALVGNTLPSDRPSHEIVAHIPLLMHPHPKRSLIIGYGLGFTAWTCRVHDTEVDVVELNPGVLELNDRFAEAFADYKTKYGTTIMKDPHVHFRVDDGRNYTLGTRRKYDFVHVGIIHPTITSGAASLYTADFYRMCERILTPDGAVSIWLPIHGIAWQDFRAILRSFRSAFPHASVWYKQTIDFCCLIGTRKPQRIDFQDFARRAAQPDIREHLRRSNVSNVYDLLDTFCFADEHIDEAVGPGRLHTDDHTFIEFHALDVGTADQLLNIKLLKDARRPVWDQLINVPEDAKGTVRARLDRAFEATQHLVEAQLRSAMIAPLASIARPEYDKVFRGMVAAFAQAHKLNPQDLNVVFNRNKCLAGHHVRAAMFDLKRDRIEQALDHLRFAADSFPETRSGREAKYLYDRISKGLPIKAE